MSSVLLSGLKYLAESQPLSTMNQLNMSRLPDFHLKVNNGLEYIFPYLHQFSSCIIEMIDVYSLHTESGSYKMILFLSE